MMTDIEREYAERFAVYEAQYNLLLPTLLSDQINRDIEEGRLRTISIGNLGQRLPDWQLDSIRQSQIWALLEQVNHINPWEKIFLKKFDRLVGCI